MRPFIQRAEYSGAKLNERCHCASPFHLNDINRVTRDEEVGGKKREGQVKLNDEISRRIGETRFETKQRKERKFWRLKCLQINLR